MAYQKKNSTRKQEKKTAVAEMPNGYFLHYRENDYGLFGLEHNGAVIYGCRLVEGTHGIFISYPSRKGNDGKYYSHARFVDPIPEETIEAIAEAIHF